MLFDSLNFGVWFLQDTISTVVGPPPWEARHFFLASLMSPFEPTMNFLPTPVAASAAGDGCGVGRVDLVRDRFGRDRHAFWRARVVRLAALLFFGGGSKVKEKATRSSSTLSGSSS